MNEPQLPTTLKEYEGTSFIYPYTELLKLSLREDIKKEDLALACKIFLMKEENNSEKESAKDLLHETAAKLLSVANQL